MQPAQQRAEKTLRNYISTTSTTDTPDFDVDALDGALNGIDISSCSATGANVAIDDVHEQEKDYLLDFFEQKKEYLLDCFEEGDLDFIGDDWDRLDTDAGVESATSDPRLPSSADWIDDLQELPTRSFQSTDCMTPLIGSAERFFDTQSMANFYDKGSSPPQRPDRTPTPNQTDELHSHSGDDDTTPRPNERVSKPSNWKIIGHVRSRELDWMSKSNVTAARRTIKQCIGIIPKSWQVAVMIDIIYTRKDVVVSARTGSGKSLPYQLIPLIKADAIVLVISPTIVLMSDQVSFTTCLAICKRNIF